MLVLDKAFAIALVMEDIEEFQFLQADKEYISQRNGFQMMLVYSDYHLLVWILGLVVIIWFAVVFNIGVRLLNSFISYDKLYSETLFV